jgi:hypothetical protein
VWSSYRSWSLLLRYMETLPSDSNPIRPCHPCSQRLLVVFWWGVAAYLLRTSRTHVLTFGDYSNVVCGPVTGFWTPIQLTIVVVGIILNFHVQFSVEISRAIQCGEHRCQRTAGTILFRVDFHWRTCLSATRKSCVFWVSEERKSSVSTIWKLSFLKLVLLLYSGSI